MPVGRSIEKGLNYDAGAFIKLLAFPRIFPTGLACQGKEDIDLLKKELPGYAKIRIQICKLTMIFILAAV